MATMNKPADSVRLTPLTGGCACGAFRYVCDMPPLLSMNCHCRDCQRHGGSAYASILVVPATSLTVLQGTLKYHAVVGDSGHHVERGFCQECGSQVLGRVAEDPEHRVIQAGSLDEPQRHWPDFDIFAARAQPWDILDPRRPRADLSPAPDQVARWLEVTRQRQQVGEP